MTVATVASEACVADSTRRAMEKALGERESSSKIEQRNDIVDLDNNAAAVLLPCSSAVPPLFPPHRLSVLDLPTHVLALCIRRLPTAADVARAALSARCFRDALRDVVLSSCSVTSSLSSFSFGRDEQETASCTLHGVTRLDLSSSLPRLEAARGVEFAARHFPRLRRLSVVAASLPGGCLWSWVEGTGGGEEGEERKSFPPLEDVSFSGGGSGRKEGVEQGSDDSESSDEDEEEGRGRPAATTNGSPTSVVSPTEAAAFLRAAAPTLRALDLGRSSDGYRLGGAVSTALRGATKLRRLRARSVGSDVLAPLAEAFLSSTPASSSDGGERGEGAHGGEATTPPPPLRSLDLLAFSTSSLSGGRSLRVLSPGIERLRLRFTAGGGGVDSGSGMALIFPPPPPSDGRRRRHPWPRLVSVDVSRCSSFDDVALSNLVGGAPRLRILRARGCHALTDAGVARAFAFAGEEGGESSSVRAPPPSLGVVDFRDCLRVGERGASAVARALSAPSAAGPVRFLVGSTGAGDAALSSLASSLRSSWPREASSTDGDGGEIQPQPLSSPRRLVELDVSGCSRASAAGLRALSDAGALKSLRKLSAANSTMLCPYSSSALESRCLGCRDRCGGNCAGSPIQLVARGAGPSLRRLSADGAPASDSAAAALGRFCSGLRSLSLVACPRLSRRGIASVARGCLDVTELSLGGGGGGGGSSGSWSERDLLPLAPRLRSLRLARRPALRDAELRELLGECSRLTRLVLSAAPRVTDEGLRHHHHQPAFLPELVSLSIPCCTGVVGNKLHSVSSKLTRLELLGCSSVTPRNVSSAALCLRRLRVLVLPPSASAKDVPLGSGHLETLEVYS